MRVLHVIPSLAPCRGGASKAAIDMVGALRECGVDAEIACTNDNGPDELELPVGELIEFEGVPARFFARFSPSGAGRIAHAVREFQLSVSFYRWLKQHLRDYDVLHVHALFSFTSSFAMRIARKQKVPYVAHPIGALEHWALQQSRWRKRAFLALLDQANLNRASLIHFTAQSEMNQASHVITNTKNLVLPLGVELPALIPAARQNIRDEFGVQPRQTVILYLGRIHPKKGLELLLQSLALDKDERTQLIVAGSGEADYYSMLRSKAVSLGVGHRTHFVGHVDGERKQQLLQGADLFALTSYSENFAISVVEAMAAGTAILVTREVGVAENLTDQGVGIVCEATVESISGALDKLISNHSNLASMGRKARELAGQDYNWGTIAKHLTAAYRGCLDQPR